MQTVVLHLKETCTCTSACTKFSNSNFIIHRNMMANVDSGYSSNEFHFKLGSMHCTIIPK